VSFIESGFIYWFFVVILMIGLYGAIAKVNLVKKLIGLSIFQTAIILFYVSIGPIGQQRDAEIPILNTGHGHGVGEIVASHYINPLPHVLMLTAIVVGVATVGVGLAVILRLYAEYGTVEEDEILEKIAQS
jgi:multicomponent Na+:H+ antiporter subunit C